MRVPDAFRSSAFRATFAFALATTVATLVIFGFVYLQITTLDEDRVRAVMVEEASKGADYSEAELERALELRLTRDLRRLDYVALFDSAGNLRLGNVTGLPDIPVDGKSHLIANERLPGAADKYEPAVFVARRRADGGILLLGRSLSDAYALRATVISALATAILPTFVLASAIGMVLARRMTRRLAALHDTIARIMRGGLQLRLPLRKNPDEIDQLSRDVNMMLDEIVRLMAQVRNVGENIAHDLRTPLSVVRVKLERGLAARDEAALRLAAADALEQLDKAIAAIAALLRVGEIENRPGARRFADIDLSAICADLFEFYEPLGRAKSISMVLDAASPVLIEGDGDLLREALSNLIDNAIKFTPEGGAVHVAAGVEAGRPVVRVSDNGAGVASEERERIFDRYFQAERVNLPRGRGVGLSIATAIRILNGGHAAIAYPAALLDIHFVHEAMEDAQIGDFLEKLTKDEIIPTVPPPPGVDLESYRELIARRFANPKIGDTIARLCFGGSDRQPKFILPVAADRLKAGAGIDGLALVSALWCRYCHGETESGKTIAPNDPNWDRIQTAARRARHDPKAFLEDARHFRRPRGRIRPIRSGTSSKRVDVVVGREAFERRSANICRSAP